MLLPGVRSRSGNSLHEPDGAEASCKADPREGKTPRTLKRQMCEELLDLIESNGMALIAAGAPTERTGPGWAAAAVLGGGEGDFTMWLGDVDDAMNFEALKERRVFAIVNMALKDCMIEQSFRHSLSRECAEDVAAEDRRWDGMKFDAESYQRHLGHDDVWYLGLDVEDALGYPIADHFDEVVAFLRRCREARRTVLVHCMQGLNRAGCACAVFLMREGLRPNAEGLGLRETVDYLSRRRAGVLQNTGFLDQLAVHGPLGREAEGYTEDLVVRCSSAQSDRRSSGEERTEFGKTGSTESAQSAQTTTSI